MLELNKSFVVRNANEVCKEVFKYTPSEIEGKILKDLMINGSDISEIKEKTGTDTFWNGVLKMKDRSGVEMKLLVSVGQVPDSANNDFMYVLYGKDISTLKNND